MRTGILFLTMAALALGCQSPETGRSPEHENGAEGPSPAADSPDTPVPSSVVSTPDLEDGRFSVATFAGGCFWCMQPPFDKLDGVVATLVGYTGGEEEHPTYEEVSRGRTGHAEAVEIVFDPAVITYDELLHVFWRSIDPTTKERQFADVGPHYRTAIFYHDAAQKEAAERSRDELQADGPFNEAIVTEIVPARPFWVAEDYHQQYYLENPDAYQRYYVGSGRAGFLERTWGQ